MTSYSTCLRKRLAENSRTLFRSRSFGLSHIGVDSSYLLILMGCPKLPFSYDYHFDSLSTMNILYQSFVTSFDRITPVLR